MSVTLVTYPANGSKKILPSHAPIEIIFKREDLAIIGVTNNSGSIRVTISGDQTSLMSADDVIFVYAEGANFTYSDSGVITTIVYSAPNTLIDISSIDYVEDASTNAYINYKKDWYLEIKLTDNSLDNNLLGYTLKDDGDKIGNVNVDISSISGILSNDLSIATGEQTAGRVILDVNYRESWLSNRAESYTNLTDTQEAIIALDAIENVSDQSIASDFTLAKVWKGYPILSSFYASQGTGAGYGITFDELDINKVALTTANLIAAGISDGTRGILQGLVSNSFVYDADTEYLDIKFSAVGTQRVRLLSPISLADADLVDYEFFLMWTAVNGAVHAYMFTDFAQSQEVSAENINTDNSNLSRIFNKHENSFTLVAENLTSNEFDVISDIIRARNVYRVYKDESFDKVLILTDEAEKRVSDGRYNFIIQVQTEDKNIYN